MRRNRSVVVGIVVGVLAGALTFGAVGVQAAPSEDRPFEGVLEGESTIEGFQGQLILTQSTGNILATHIGSGTYTIDGSQDYVRHVETDHPGGNCAFVNGTVTITAANGDTLEADIDGDRSVVCAPDEQGPNPMPGDSYYSTIYSDVTGGTGRFADATGWLFSEGTSTLRTDGSTEDLATIYGDIDY